MDSDVGSEILLSRSVTRQCALEPRPEYIRTGRSQPEPLKSCELLMLTLEPDRLISSL